MLSQKKPFSIRCSFKERQNSRWWWFMVLHVLVANSWGHIPVWDPNRKHQPSVHSRLADCADLAGARYRCGAGYLSERRGTSLNLTSRQKLPTHLLCQGKVKFTVSEIFPLNSNTNLWNVLKCSTPRTSTAFSYLNTSQYLSDKNKSYLLE